MASKKKSTKKLAKGKKLASTRPLETLQSNHPSLWEKIKHEF